MVLIGLERVIREPELLSGTGRLGLLYNQSSVDSRFRSAAEAVSGSFPAELKILFGPQHGVALTEQDNMRETGHTIHPTLGLPVYSLYSHTRKPNAAMLEGVDTILVDLQDVGTRVYTFATTVVYLMEAAAQADKSVVILDRPNPIDGHHVEGNVLNPRYASFVGPYPIPMRHGLTLGELMLLYHAEYGIGCRLNVVTMSGWDRTGPFENTGVNWVMPSPNMPLVETAVVYPGQVILEGTNLSEGRGTTRPFEIFGAPFVNPAELQAHIDNEALAGAVLREVAFKPTCNKWMDEMCRGFQIHVTDRNVYRPYRCTLAVLSAIRKLYPEQFRWSDPPYEYVYDKLPVDVILGDDSVRRDLEQGRSVRDMEEEWQPELDRFMRVRSKFLLY
jgi:uncharacterized protein YbbC (DUF1343 family)